MAPERGKLQVVDVDSGRPQFTLELHEGEIIAALAFSPDGTRLAAGMRGGAVHVWDMGKLSTELAALGLASETPLAARNTATTRERIEVVQWVHE